MAEQYQEIFNKIETENGLRSTWNIWPKTRIDAIRMGVPLSVLYTPLKHIPNLTQVKYPPLHCSGCKCILNPFMYVDYDTKQFTCPFCMNVQAFPPYYGEISRTSRPAEILPQFKTLEYDLTAASGQAQSLTPPTYLFVVDTCTSEKEFDKVREALQWAIDALPEGTRVGLITYGTTIQIHELIFDFCPRRVVFRGNKEFEQTQVEQFLGLRGQGEQRFLLPLAQCQETIAQVVEDLTIDPWAPQPKNRPYRATGAALSLAAGLLGSLGQGGRIVLLAAGPCTLGPGQIVDTDVHMHVRHHHDITKRTDSAKYLKDARRFYGALAEQVVKASVSIHAFACSTDQVGLLELRPAVERTGGHMLISESFNYHAFERSFRKLFEHLLVAPGPSVLQMATNGEIELQVSSAAKICGAIGPCSSLGSRTPAVSTQEIGVGLTDKWRMCSIDSDQTLAFFLDISPEEPASDQGQRYLQLRTSYIDPRGHRILRVTTFGYKAEAAMNLPVIAGGFDQEAAAAVTARLACWRADGGADTEEVVHSVDRVVIRLSHQFSQFNPGDTTSFQLYSNFEYFPQFMYHFRRSEMVQLFGQSPDETACKRFHLCRQTVTNTLTMIQPVIVKYTLEEPTAEPVFLDSSELRPERVLLFDSFFNVCVWVGGTIAQWRNAGYHEKPEYANVKTLLEAPNMEVEEILSERFPAPRFDETDQRGSQARIIVARLNPSTTHKNGDFSAPGQGEVVATDDVSLQVFIEHLKNAVVNRQ
eukprot:gnl/Dysnectes_brevis/2512_a3008_1291.p1 GENE.gnl/Dysnectes_brevis/2512_a3008_1291~~gnl/Dysnectes_brevis/2512_a3008_1291.p1  ORF type:complete len:757 (+),score=253.46 gnl/Dysnectes_brevis/2512_a3008_1291:115-2385(+)